MIAVFKTPSWRPLEITRQRRRAKIRLRGSTGKSSTKMMARDRKRVGDKQRGDQNEEKGGSLGIVVAEGGDGRGGSRFTAHGTIARTGASPSAEFVDLDRSMDRSRLVEDQGF
ncbi:hypothetical protein B296_00013231 [Ensete ventricosum]|uniref:Uncharacterized protein n=1 Tax=Ensete ventricosum TaxID=4639 RepID=A0A426ZE29_ENSVE|nr:hypothetical protein B296_00013231 [Ensete ventricosum]